MKILLDNGHGSNTMGKCSPDKLFLEWKWTREIAEMLEHKLRESGYDVDRIVKEDIDISLRERCNRVNNICNKLGAKNVLLISIHSNAAGADMKWHDATGFSPWIAPNASSNSKKLGKIFTENATKMDLMGNRWIPKEKYWIGNFTMVTSTKCPAVLTESMFYDNKEDCKFLLSDLGKEKIVELHYKAITEYINLVK